MKIKLMSWTTSDYIRGCFNKIRDAVVAHKTEQGDFLGLLLFSVGMTSHCVLRVKFIFISWLLPDFLKYLKDRCLTNRKGEEVHYRAAGFAIVSCLLIC